MTPTTPVYSCESFNPAYDFNAPRKDKNRILKLIDLDSMFHTSPNPIVLNEHDFTNPGYAEELNSKLFSRSGSISFVASCDCGHLNDNYYQNTICPKCNTPVVSDLETENGHLIHRVWISAPDVPLKRGETRDAYDPNKEIYWLHPHVYRILAKWLHHGRQSATNHLDDILNPSNKLHPDVAPFIKGRGFRYLYENFDAIMWTFCHEFKPLQKKDPQRMWRFIQENRHLIFCSHLPVLASSLHPIVSADPTADPASSRHFVDEASKFVLEAANGLSFMTYSVWRSNRKGAVDEAIFKAYLSYIAYNEIIIATRLSKKKSLQRQHIFGARYHMSGRAVIIPITGPHRYDELHMPWAIMVNMLRPMLFGRLLRRGYDANDIFGKFHHAMFRHDPELQEIMDALIAECPYPGIPVLFNRNPSLKRGSVQLLFATVVKKDPEDLCVSMSNLVLKDPNSDYDGDQMNIFPIFEMDAMEHFKIMHPAHRILATNMPEVGTSINLPPQIQLVASRFLGQV